MTPTFCITSFTQQHTISDIQPTQKLAYVFFMEILLLRLFYINMIMIGDTIHMYNLQQNAFAHDMNLAHISSKFKQVVHCKKLFVKSKAALLLNVSQSSTFFSSNKQFQK